MCLLNPIRVFRRPSRSPSAKLIGGGGGVGKEEKVETAAAARSRSVMILESACPRVRCPVFEVERVLAAGGRMKENGEIESITLHYFVLRWSRRICGTSHFSAIFSPI